MFCKIAMFFGALLSFLFLTRLEAEFDPIQDEFIHEAYISKDNGPVEFNAVSAKPPELLIETMPEKTFPQAIWVPGHWVWSTEHRDFIWISGVWRIPPPGMVWIQGFWHHFEEGWVWIKGFWSPKEKEKLVYIDVAPPDPIAENPEFPESSNYFWNPGNFIFHPKEEKYLWLSGSWELFDANWVLVPSHYEWLLDGYVFIPAYWDWPIGRRGTPYAPIFIPKVSRKSTFVPTTIASESHIYQLLLVHYPDYLSLVHYTYHYHPEYWGKIVPTWWQWHSWWSLPWQNLWGLWWWYTHPGYVQPEGLTSDVSEKIRAANPRLLQMMEPVHEPFIVTPTGVVAPQTIFNVMNGGKPFGQKAPIMPADPKLIAKIKLDAVKAAPKQAEGKEQEVEPSRRGKLHGFKEAVPPSSEVKALIKQAGDVVSLPKKPVLTPGEPAKAGEHDSSGANKKKKSEAIKNSEIKQIPVKDLRDARRPFPPKSSGGLKPSIPPDPTIIRKVLPTPDSGA